MNKGNLLVSTLLMLLLTGLLFAHADWLPSRKPAHAAPGRGQAHIDEKPQDPMCSQSARRWRDCQPSHWRGYMLQR
jgi:hypothetical protein